MLTCLFYLLHHVYFFICRSLVQTPSAKNKSFVSLLIKHCDQQLNRGVVHIWSMPHYITVLMLTSWFTSPLSTGLETWSYDLFLNSTVSLPQASEPVMLYLPSWISNAMLVIFCVITIMGLRKSIKQEKVKLWYYKTKLAFSFAFSN